jgi:transposase InsO family protein
MPFKKTTAMDQKQQFIGEWIGGELDLSKLCRKYGVSRPTGYKWVNRYKEEGHSGLEERSHDAKTHCNALDPALEDLIVVARGRHPTWGPKKLLEWIQRTEGLNRICAPSTAGEILRREGLSVPRKVIRRTTPWVGALGPFEDSNAIWCVDFKGWFRLGNGQRCDPLTMTDGFSRYLLRCQCLKRTGLEETRRIFEAAFWEYGLPERIRSDNGAPFGSIAIGGLSQLAVWLMKLGIAPERIDPGCPYQNGRHERMHLTLNEAIKTPAYDFRGQQRRFNAFRKCFNEERPHEALGQRTPASVYQVSLKKYTGRVQEPLYESRLATRKVQSNGEFNWNGMEFFLSETLRGETIGLEELSDGKWAIQYGAMVLGTLDERAKKIVPENSPRKRRKKCAKA